MKNIFINKNYELLSNLAIEYKKNRFYNLRSFFKKPLAIIGTSILLLIVIASIVMPFIVPRFFGADPYDINPNIRNLPAFTTKDGIFYLLGTDSQGYDLFSRIVHGLRYTLLISLAVVLVDMIVGVFIGILMGYYPMFRKYMELIIKVFTTIPSLLIYLIIGVILGSGVHTIIIALTIAGWIPMALLVSSNVRSYKAQLFTTASRVLGSSNRKIYTSYFGLIIPIILTQIMITISSAIQAEAIISILGLGLIDTPTIGSILETNRSSAITFPMLILWPSLIILLILVAVQFIRDALNSIALERKR